MSTRDHRILSYETISPALSDRCRAQLGLIARATPEWLCLSALSAPSGALPEAQEAERKVFYSGPAGKYSASCIPELAEKIGIKPKTIYWALDHGGNFRAGGRVWRETEAQDPDKA